MTKDYYKILGVAEFNTTDEIKIAYRKLVRKWHPDVAGNSSDVVLRFKDITEAYETLSNPIKKEEYDRARRFYNYAHSKDNEFNQARTEKTEKAADKKNEAAKKGFTFGWEDFISRRNQAKSFNREKPKAPKNGNDIYTDVEVDMFEAIEGVIKTINMLQTHTCSHCHGRKFVNGNICPECKGKGETTSYKKFNVKIPAGVKNNSKIRLSGEGTKGVNGGKNGDLYITIHVCESKYYRTENLNIHKTVIIAPHEAVLGCTLNVDTPTGTYIVKIAPNTQNGQKIRLSRCGIVQNEQIGDIIITVEIHIPKNLSQAEIDLYKKLEYIAQNSMRDNNYGR